jgi:hypothetical protein
MAARDFLIVCTSADRALADWIARELESAGYSILIHAFDIRPGMNYLSEMQKGAEEPLRTLIVLSPNFLESKFTEAELTSTFGRDPAGQLGKLVPVRMVECNPAGLLGSRIYINLVGLEEDAARGALLDAVKGGTEPAVEPMSRKSPRRLKGKKGNLPLVGGGPMFVILRRETAMDLFTALAQALVIPVDGKKGKTKGIVKGKARGTKGGKGFKGGKGTKGEGGAVPAQEERHVNVCFADPRSDSVIPDDRSLGTNFTYRLRINIGPLLSETAVMNAESHPFPAHLLPPEAHGHWLAVVVKSEQFRIKSSRYSLFLPVRGPSWVCNCQFGSPHSCFEDNRNSYLYVRLQTPAVPCTASLRLAIFYLNNLVQSLRVETVIEDQPTTGFGYQAVVDFTLAAALNNLPLLSVRNVGILAAKSQGSPEGLIVIGERDISFPKFNEGLILGAVTSVRAALREIHYEEFGGHLGAKRGRTNLLAEDSSKEKDAFVRDLEKLVPLGANLWLAAFPDRATRLSLKESLKRAGATIQVARTSGNTFAFPWSVIYDISLSSDIKEHRVCRLVRDWTTERKGLLRHERGCPYEAEHKKDTICPYGFWGFRHVIEQLPSFPTNCTVPLFVSGRQQPQDVIVSRSDDKELNPALIDRHLKALEKELPAFTLRECRTRNSLQKVLSEEIEVLYFYCHGMSESMPGGKASSPYLKIGADERFYPRDLTVWGDENWRADHWKITSPLVFINGCRTAELSPELLTNFVDAFSMERAAGVIGTEIAVSQLLAAEVAETFFHSFAQNKTVGEAMRVTRLELLHKGNLLGLCYTPYCLAELRLGKVPAHHPV